MNSPDCERYGSVSVRRHEDPLPSPLMTRETHHIIKFKSAPSVSEDTKKSSSKTKKKEKRRLKGLKKLLSRKKQESPKEEKEEDASSIVRGRNRKSNVVVTVHTNDVETAPSPLTRGRSLSRSTSFKKMMQRSLSITSDPANGRRGRGRSRSRDASSVYSSASLSLGDKLKSRVKSFRSLRSLSRSRKRKSKRRSAQNVPHQRVLFVKETHSPAAVMDFEERQLDESFELGALCASFDSFSLCRNIFSNEDGELIGKVISGEDDTNSIVTSSY